MQKLTFDISMSLDGFVAGPNAGPDNGLGDGGEQLHEWVTRLAVWREPHGKSGGETNRDSEIFEESQANVGATIMGRRMFNGDQGPWGDEPSMGWWGDEPPFHMPVFVITHHPRETEQMQGGTSFTFITDGIEAALEQARAAAGDKDVFVAGGGSVIRQYLDAGLVDEFQVHVAPVLLGGGVRLFDNLRELPTLEVTRTVESPAVTHLRYRVLKD
ncbi:MAG: dihydrofolate reductase family protein [Thermoleophilaceae bacterium]